MSNNKDMPAGYDPQLDTELDPDNDIDGVFGAPPAVDESSEHEVDKQVFGESSSSSSQENPDFAGLFPNSKGSGKSIFESALKAEQEKKKKGDSIPAYAKELMSQQFGKPPLMEQEDEDEEEETDDDFDVDDGMEGDEDFSDVGFDDADLDFDDDDDFTGGGDAGGGGFDFEGGVDLDDDDTDEVDFDEDDVLQTERWQDEDDIDTEMARLLGDDSPYQQGMSNRAFDPASSPTYTNMHSASGIVDEDVVGAERFASGGFIESFEDGFVFVDKNGASLAIVDAEEGDEGGGSIESGEDVSDNNLAAYLLFRPEGTDPDEEGEDIGIELTKEELSHLADAINQMTGTTVAGAGATPASFMEQARRKTTAAKNKSKKQRRRK